MLHLHTGQEEQSCTYYAAGRSKLAPARSKVQNVAPAIIVRKIEVSMRRLPLIKAFLCYICCDLSFFFSRPRSQQFDGTAAISLCLHGFAAISASFFRSRDHSNFEFI